MKNGQKIRKGIYDISTISKLIPSLPVKEFKTERVELDGDKVFVDSHRLICFKKDDFVCTCCGLKGAFFAKEKHPNDGNFHLEFYALNSDGEEVIMTKDHRVPRSKGGSNSIENLDTMCGPCNWRKGNNVS